MNKLDLKRSMVTLDLNFDFKHIEGSAVAKKMPHMGSPTLLHKTRGAPDRETL